MKKAFLMFAAAAALAGCVRDDGTVKMATEATFAPYEFLRGREIVGVDVEVCRAIAERLGREFRVENMDFDAIIPSVISGKADLAAAGITITEDRRKSVDFSIPYVKTGIVVIYKKSNPYAGDLATLKGRRVGVQSGTTSDTFVLEKLGQEPERFHNFSEACASLVSGRCDFVIADSEIAKNAVKGESALAHSDFLTSEEFAIAVKKGRPELLKAVNATIEALKADGRLSKWIVQYTEESDKLKEK